MSLSQFTQKHDDLMCVLAVSAVIAVAVILVVIYAEWNDQQYFKTLDKLTCTEIWELMINGHIDWDTLDYYGDRC